MEISFTGIFPGETALKLLAKLIFQLLRLLFESKNDIILENLALRRIQFSCFYDRTSVSIISHYSTSIRHPGTNTYEPRCQTINPKGLCVNFLRRPFTRKTTTNRCGIC